ncbi:hypothetical protein M0802_010906 [Mischocyttarus mexicanus]|nr:hypothetical protein M0802_010906 [Mischocyttarus mexicanus]
MHHALSTPVKIRQGVGQEKEDEVEEEVEKVEMEVEVYCSDRLTEETRELVVLVYTSYMLKYYWVNSEEIVGVGSTIRHTGRFSINW